ncbi:porin [Burkholderia cepacia]|uniref:porin n=1 Tax=Burkholderia cepacia TaxID=292 RepID=UPI00075C489D|nr:porin [Burkholderia cepacia]KVW89303.1 porin [Burkholderia cepacia]KVX72598.1 porin [Burkholderia cepacia]
MIALAVAAAPVCAQSSVTLYGMVDNALAYVNNQNGHSNVYMRQGNLYASKWGLRGSEDLGGGLRAIFDLQNGFDPNTGALASSGVMFNRQAYVGLQSQAYGTFTAGRQYTPYFQFVGPLASSTWLTGATGAHPGDIDGLDTTVRANNSIVYSTPTWNGVQASVMYALGGIPGSLGRGQTISGAIRYSGGPLGIAMGFLRMTNAETVSSGFDPGSTGSFATSPINVGYVTANSVQNASVAGNYTMGNMTFGLNYSNVKYVPDGHSVFKNTAVFNTYAALAVYRVTPAFDVACAVSYTLASRANGIEDAARYQQYSLKEAYHLSKRTTLYALQAYQRTSGQTLGAKGAGNIITAAPAVGDSQNSTPSTTRGQFVGMVGMAVTF